MKKFSKILLNIFIVALAFSIGVLSFSCKQPEEQKGLTEEDIYQANKSVKIEMLAEDFILTSCETRNIDSAKNGVAVMLNSDSGFIHNSRGYAEARFDVPESGYFQVVVSGGANSYTPVECWINDYEQKFLEFNTLSYSDFTTVGFIHYFEKGRNVIRFLGPGSAYYATIDAMYVRGFSTPSNVASALEVQGIKVPEGETNLIKLLPNIAGFEYEFANTSDANVVKKDGIILADNKDGDDKTCDVKIKVVR